MKPKLTHYLALFLVLFAQITFAQERSVSGTVSDNNGLPLPGVSVLVKGSKEGTQTDFDGKFKIQASATQVLVFSYIGMKTKELVAKTASLNVKMEDNATDLEGVVVTAFGIKRKPKNLGYSISTIKAKELSENAEPDLIRSLSGKVAGVNVNVSSGVAGASNQILIRGIASFSGEIQPLIIVDGVAYDNQQVTSSSQTSGGGGYETGLSSLDPNNIASVNVLKSVAAAALYGSRARNGVIVITTKTGSSGTKKSEKLRVNVGTGTYFENIANLPEYQNTYGAGANFAYSNANGSWGPRFDSMSTIPTWPSLLSAFPSQFGSTVPYVAKPNNVKDLFRTGIVRDNTAGFEYAGNDGSFNVTLSDMKQDGYIPFNTYNRTSISVGGNFKISEKLTGGGNMSYSSTDQVGGFFGENQYDGASSSFARTLYLARNWDLNLPYVNPATGGSVTPNGTQFDHPMWSWEHDQIKTKTYRTVAGLNLNYKFNNHMSASYRAGINRYLLDRDEIRDLESRADSGIGSLLRDTYANQDLESTLLLNLDYKLTEKIDFTAILGNNVVEQKNFRTSSKGKEFNFPNVFTLNNVKTITNLFEDSYTSRKFGFFYDLTFSFNNVFFINTTGRRDQSSTLPKSKNSYFYPSISSSFVLTDAFKIKSKVLTFAKLRASYAKVGYDAEPEFIKFGFTQGFTYNTQSTISVPTTLSNPFIEPEFTTEMEAGTEFELFNKRIAVDFSIYNKSSTNLLANVPVPSSSGYSYNATNSGSMENKGVELALTLVPLKTENFKWSIFTTYTKNRNKVTEIAPGVDRSPIDVNNIGYMIPGQAFGVFYGTRFARDAQGNYLINQNGGGIIADLESGIIGDPNPDFKMSIKNTFTYKGFSLKAQFDWKKGGDVSSTTIQSLLGRGVTRDTEDREHTFVIPGYYGNASGTPILDASGNQIPNTVQLSMNELYFSPAGGNTFAINSVDEASIYDGTVFRLREASLSYDVPKKFLEKTPFGAISFSVVGSNLWYFAPNVPKYTNYDPDATSYGSTRLQGIEVTAAPTAKRYGFKLNLTF